MENLKELKERAENNISLAIDNLEKLQEAYGVIKIEEALALLREVRRSFQLDLERLNDKN